MTNDSNAVDSAEDSQKTEVETLDEIVAGQSLEEQVAKLTSINAELIKSRDAVKRKTREVEREAEANKTLAGSLKDKLVSKIVNDSLKEALGKAGALSIDTAMKLVDRSKIQLSEEFEIDSKNIEDIVSELQKSDSILFKPVENEDKTTNAVVKHTSVARPGETDKIVSSYEQTLRGAKSQRQIEDIMRKFGKLN